MTAPLIPRETLFGNPERLSVRLSPDGQRLAYIAPHEGVLNVWVRTLGGDDDRCVTRDRRRGIRTCFWVFDGKRICYLQDADGDENWHLWCVEVEAGVIRDMTPFLGAQAQVVALDPERPSEALVALNVRSPRAHDVYRIDLVTGAATVVVTNPGDVVGWLADASMEVRAATAAMPDGGFALRVRETGSDDWRTVLTWGPDDEGQAHAFSSNGRELFLCGNVGADTQELQALDLSTGALRTLAAHPEVDMSAVFDHPRGHAVRAARFVVDRAEWRAVDPAVSRDLERLTDPKRGDLSFASMDLSDRRWIVQYSADRAPASYHLYDRKQGTLEFLFSARPALDSCVLAEMQPVRIRSRDGLTLHAYLTVPPWPSDGPAPLVLNVHGGPWARDSWGYDPEAQWLANRGYACLQVNYRGSAGFGKRFLHAGDREWGAKMHDDLLDAVDWAVGEGIADPKRVAIYGSSYGGYAALVGAAFTPDVFACAVDIVGPSSLRTLIGSIPPYWEPLRRVLYHRIGNLETEPEFLDDRSPLFRAADIRCPLLIAQGANDPRVKQQESEQMVEAVRARGGEVEYIVFEDEGHGFARPENRLRFYAAAERFLARHLGGRAEE
ncbi:MAG TPA: S9 family peptidase [Chthonomonadales bacterium]|nr:S9 family peptidase [Chthonomonadales bacterium]